MVSKHRVGGDSEANHPKSPFSVELLDDEAVRRASLAGVEGVLDLCAAGVQA